MFFQHTRFEIIAETLLYRTPVRRYIHHYKLVLLFLCTTKWEGYIWNSILHFISFMHRWISIGQIGRYIRQGCYARAKSVYTVVYISICIHLYIYFDSPITYQLTSCSAQTEKVHLTNNDKSRYPNRILASFYWFLTSLGRKNNLIPSAPASSM